MAGAFGKAACVDSVGIRPHLLGMSICIHGTCIEIDGHGVLLVGPPGSGKSDLALRLIDDGALLVADDQTQLVRRDGGLYASTPTTLAGLMEVRGLGILRFPYRQSTPLRLIIDVATHPERMPETKQHALLGVELPWFAVVPFEASAATKVRLAVRCVTGDIITANG